MQRLRHCLLAAALVSCLFGPALVAEEGSAPTVSLRWALGAIETDGSTPSAIQRDTQLESGARLKFLVEPLSNGSVYLIMLDSDDAIQVLYRETTSLSDGEDGQPTYIPPAGHWFALQGDAGLETFFLLASVEPLTELEELLDRHASAAPASQKEIGSEIVGEIRRLNRKYRNFSRPVEKPVMIGGQTRGGPGDSAAAIDRLAVDVRAEQFYGKTITIDH